MHGAAFFASVRGGAGQKTIFRGGAGQRSNPPGAGQGRAGQKDRKAISR